MSGRKNTNNHKLNFGASTEGDMSADLTSEAVQIQFQDNVGLQIKWAGVAVGIITVECSNNKNPSENVDGDFYALTFDPAITQPAGASGGYLVDLNQLPFQWLRVAYEATSDSGTLEVWLTSKEV